MYIKVILPIWVTEVMFMRKEVAIISVTRNGRITIPEDVRKELSILNGNKLKVEVQTENGKKTIILTKI